MKHGAHVRTSIPDAEWTGSTTSLLPKRGQVYVVMDVKTEDGIEYLQLIGMGNTWYLSNGFKEVMYERQAI